jgi:hypothetical protein
MKCNQVSEAGSSVSISVLLLAGRPGDRGSIPGKGERIFPLAFVSRPVLVPTHPPVQWVPGVLSGVKSRPGCDADHSPPSSAEVVNELELYLPSTQASSWRVVGQL